MVQGIFPFIDSSDGDMYYSLLRDEKYEKYWSTVEGEGLDPDLKDLF